VGVLRSEQRSPLFRKKLRAIADTLTKKNGLKVKAELLALLQA